MRRTGAERAVRFVLVFSVLLLAGRFALGMDANPLAELGTDERGGPCPPDFGFAYYVASPVPGGATDVCETEDGVGGRALEATDGVASSENPEPILHLIGEYGPNTVTFIGRTGNCYYIVTGRYLPDGIGGGGVGGVGGEEPEEWTSEFASNEETPYFVVTINNRHRSDDDRFFIGGRSLIRVELHDEGGVMPNGFARFILTQQPTPGHEEGAVQFVDAAGEEIDPTEPRDVYTGVPNEEVYATGVEEGHVTIMALQAPPDDPE